MVEIVLASKKPMAILELSGTALISAGAGDDAICYHAVIGSSIKKPMVFIAYFHSSSLLLERVVIQGSILVEVLLGQREFLGELRLGDGLEPKGELYALEIRLYDEREPKEMADRLCPMT